MIVVAKKSSLSRARSGDGDSRASRLLSQGHPAVSKWKPAHEQHVRTVDQVVETLERLGVETLLLHGAQAEFDPRGASLVVSVGGDGTLLAASHSVDSVPLLGINSAPSYSVGFFCAASGRAIGTTIARALQGDAPVISLQRMAVSVNGQLRSERVLNEALYCHAEPAATSNYLLKIGRKTEEQRSSGFWVGPAAGSTAAMRSAGGKILPLASTELQLIVREPYVGQGHRLRLKHAIINRRSVIRVTSKMERVRIYLDGPYRMLSARLGDEVSFFASKQPLQVVGLTKRGR